MAELGSQLLDHTQAAHLWDMSAYVCRTCNTSCCCNNALIWLSLGLFGLAIIKFKTCYLLSIICSFDSLKSLNTLKRLLGVGSSWRVPQLGDFWKYMIPSLHSQAERGQDVRMYAQVSSSQAEELIPAVLCRPGPQGMQPFICLMNCPERHKENRRAAALVLQLADLFTSPQSLSEIHLHVSSPVLWAP